jgi:hypothetical protein
MELFGVVRQHDSEEIASDKVSKNYAHIYDYYLENMGSDEIKWYATIIKSICYTVSKSAHNKQGYSKKKRYVMLLAGKCNGGSHHKSARNTEKPAEERSPFNAKRKYILCSLMNWQMRYSRYHAHDKASCNVASEDYEQLSKFILLDESSGSCI